ncbi:hypothetical protein Mapa_006893 [Marchantia paleacea]|nr:hypothetical protein Mapa_006893 [Marchantia paleacea]
MRSVNNWLAFSLSPHLTIDVPDHAPSAQTNGPKMAQHSSAENGLSYNGAPSGECYNLGQSDGDTLSMRPDGSLCIMEALSRSHSGDWAQLKTSHVQHPSQHLLNADLSRLAGSRAPSEQITQNQYDSLGSQSNKSDHDSGPKLEDFLGGASSLGGQYTNRSDSQSHNFDNLYFRDINVNLSPYSGGAQQQANHVPPSFHAYGLQRTDNSSTQQPYDSHSRNNTAAEPNLCHPNVHAQNLLQVALDQHHHPGSAQADMLQDCSLQSSNLSALKTWLRQSQSATGSGGVNALGSADNKQQQQPGLGKASCIPNIAGVHQSLSLSMSPGSQSSNTLVGAQPPNVTAETSPETRKRGAGRAGSKEASPRKSIDTFGQRTSVFRGVTRHRWTGRYEAHLWDNSCRKEGQTRKGRQGGYDKEEKAARAYDLAALKYWGPNTTINFPIHQYEKELEEMKNMTRQEYVASLRRKSSGFSRGASVYRGVTRHHQHGRWQARIGRVAGNKDLYLGTYSTQEEAAEAYDIAAIKFRGINAVTNFDISRYDTKKICGTAHNTADGESPKVQVASTKELAAVPPEQPSDPSVDGHQTDEDSQSLQTGNTNTSQVTDGLVSKSHLQEWHMLYHQQQTQRNWDDANQQQQQQQQSAAAQAQQQQDVRTQSLISDSLGHKFLQSPAGNMHSAVLRNLMGLSDAGTSGSESSGGMLALPGPSSTMMGGSSGFPGAQSPKSLREQQQTEDESSKSGGQGGGGGSAYENVLQGDLSRHILYLSHGQSPPNGSAKSTNNYDNSSLGNQSWMSPQGNLNQRVTAAGHLSVGHMPIFAVWND